MAGVEHRLQPLRVVGVRRERAVLDGFRHLRRALDVELAGLPFEILLAASEKMRRDFLCLVADLARGERAGRARGRRRAARLGPAAVPRGVGVALLPLHVRGADAEPLPHAPPVGLLLPPGPALRSNATGPPPRLV